ncbi:hypothetical protein C7N43_27455 [Sphingobacteriales bacterium UPWRP_1]|nr:hypothetical protein BVG80_05305 [Sphingobacteriales bacterium TSM_CSM]PSJ73777.1 hypothetical protein C7N43_27455 [Sphingobacteriales bacterium UPWRP_1]
MCRQLPPPAFAPKHTGSRQTGLWVSTENGAFTGFFQGECCASEFFITASFSAGCVSVLLSESNVFKKLGFLLGSSAGIFASSETQKQNSFITP